MRRIAVVGSSRALDALEPLCRAYARVGTVSAVEAPIPDERELRSLAGEADAILVAGDCRRSPRTALCGPVVSSPDGRRVPVGWVPDVGWAELRRFAVAAASVHARRAESVRVRTVAVLAQRSRRYRDLSERIERLLTESGGVASPLRWTADVLVRADLARGLGYGLSAAVYVGHGRPVGWVGYRGTRAHHLGDAQEPTAAVLSLTCLTASRRRVGTSFAEGIVLAGGAASSFGAVCSTEHRWNARWALRIAGGLAAGCDSLGELVAAAEAHDPAVAAYRIIGDPVAPLVDHPDATARAEALTRAVSLAA